MALTIGTPTYTLRPSSRGKRMGWVTIAFDSSYPTGGEALAASDIDGLESQIDVLIAFSGQSGYVFDYDKTNEKVLVYQQKNPADAGGADIPLPEVGNAGDLSGLTAVTFFFIGL